MNNMMKEARLAYVLLHALATLATTINANLLAAIMKNTKTVNANVNPVLRRRMVDASLSARVILRSTKMAHANARMVLRRINKVNANLMFLNA